MALVQMSRKLVPNSETFVKGKKAFSHEKKLFVILHIVTRYFAQTDNLEKLLMTPYFS